MSEDTDITTSTPQTISNRNSARISAVQALYEIDVTNAPVDRVLNEFMTQRWKHAGKDGTDEAVDLPGFDEQLLEDIITGVASGQGEFDAMISEELSGSWTLDRLEVLVRVILRAGTYELARRQDIPMRVVINEYVNVSHAFFVENEPAMVNGVLDKIARKLRHHEQSS
jgi:N utilization substance protein B